MKFRNHIPLYGWFLKMWQRKESFDSIRKKLSINNAHFKSFESIYKRSKKERKSVVKKQSISLIPSTRYIFGIELIK